MLYFRPFIFSFIATCFLAPLVYWAAIKFFKWPKRPRDIHEGIVPRFGGVALILVFWLAVILDPNLVVDKPLFGAILASALILVFGIWDDLKDLKPRIQFIAQIFLTLIVIGVGVSVDYIRNPFGGVIRLDDVRLAIGDWHLSVFGSLFAIAWIILIINVVNWLDGLDGLAGGVSLIGFLSIFLLSISSLINQPPIGILAIILTGALLGFLIFNFPRKKGSIIFLGTSGSMFLGFMIGFLSILSGSKVATALLVFGVAVIDAFWVIWQRKKSGASIFKGDRRHLHHQLLNLGFNQRQIVLFYLAIGVAFGAIALISGTQGKIIAFFVLCVIMVLLIYGIRSYKNRRQAR